MKFALSIRYLRLIDAAEGNLDYESYLKLGLTCPREGCSARLFFVKGRAAHQRNLPSRNTVPVKACEPYFACFEGQECVGLCERGEMSRRERDRLSSIHREQRRKKIWSHFLQMYEMSNLQINANREEVEALQENEYFQDIFPLFRDFYRENRSDIVEATLQRIDMIFDPENHEMVAEAVKRLPGTEHFKGLSEWLLDLETPLHKAHVKEALEFIAQPRQEGVLRWVSCCALMSIASLEGESLPFWSQDYAIRRLCSAIGSQFAVTRWADNWNEICEE